MDDADKSQDSGTDQSKPSTPWIVTYQNLFMVVAILHVGISTQAFWSNNSGIATLQSEIKEMKTQLENQEKRLADIENEIRIYNEKLDNIQTKSAVLVEENKEMLHIAVEKIKTLTVRMAEMEHHSHKRDEEIQVLIEDNLAEISKTSEKQRESEYRNVQSLMADMRTDLDRLSEEVKQSRRKLEDLGTKHDIQHTEERKRVEKFENKLETSLQTAKEENMKTLMDTKSTIQSAIDEKHAELHSEIKEIRDSLLKNV